ncbi:oxidoreductase [Pseudidiomarina sediminum]|uniref:NADPH--hemoprotein reductase n=1 Tax=Pseudidiomarina sediminum TaxID=431675 RepID=A0A432Z2Q3_9GAMM|nr:NADPH cytochrome P450 oxidoreductase family protein [Pseudidiomarina sediminum]RUO72161.1 oxidoreductase [Pseudidiomarina sediminum]
MSEGQQVYLAFTIVVVWTLWTCRTVWREFRSRAVPTALSPSTLVVAYASQTGTAKALAEQKVAALQQQFPEVQLRALSELTLTDVQKVTRMIFVVSTYGEGEPPDNGRRFYRQLLRLVADGVNLSHMGYEIVALGDRRYPRFCEFGIQLDAALQAAKAQRLQPMLKHDRMTQVTSDNVDDACVWQLTERSRLNGRASDGLYLLRLSTEQALPQWRAGDVLDVLPCYHPGSDAERPEHAPRSYSIASVPAEGQLLLIVRQQVNAAGQLGLCSGWLTQSLTPGAKLLGRVRRNTMCHLSDLQAPLLLIGAGSGLAGLRSQIAQRAQHADAGPIWLIYGERFPQEDVPLAQEIDQWLQRGVLRRVDRVFSRDAQAPAYVQSVISEKAAQVQEFLGQQGHVYVCGSYARMGTGVERSLRDAIGEQSVDQLLHEQRYHRDLY